MPITAQCPGCQSRFNLQDQLAGQQVQCQRCQTVFAAPLVSALPQQSLKSNDMDFDHTGSTSGLQQTETDKKEAPKKHSTVYTKVKNTKPTDNSPLIVGGIVSLIVLTIALVGVGIWFLVSSGSDDEVADGNSSNVGPNGTTIENADSEDSEGEDGYTQEKEALKAQNAARNLERLNEQFNFSTVTVKFTNVVHGDTHKATRYLKNKIMDAVYAEYRLANEQARMQTEANKARAEATAIAQHGDSYRGIVFYEYQEVRGPVRYPRVVEGGRSGTSISFLCGPCKNAATFASTVGMPNTSVNGNVVTIKVNYPDGFPHPAEEKLREEHGDSSVVTVKISEATGDPELVKLYLQEKTPKKLDDRSRRITVAAIEKTGSKKYQFFAGPVGDINYYADELESQTDWAEVTKIDPNKRVVFVKASLPEVMPTRSDFQELKEIRQKIENEERKIRREEERVAREKEREEQAIARKEESERREAERAAERAMTEADRAGKARPGETNADWISRSFAEKSPSYFDEFLDQLVATKVDPEILPMVSDNLVKTLKENKSSYQCEKIFDAMFAWQTDETDAAIMEIVADPMYSSKVPELMEAMEKIGTEEAAEQLAIGLTHRSEAETAQKHLISMGKMVEPMVMPYMRHQDIAVRYRAYEILFHVGTPDSLPTLTENRKMEKNVEMRKNIKSVIDAINERYPEEEE